eukprot:g4663.t1
MISAELPTCHEYMQFLASRPLWSHGEVHENRFDELVTEHEILFRAATEGFTKSGKDGGPMTEQDSERFSADFTLPKELLQQLHSFSLQALVGQLEVLPEDVVYAWEKIKSAAVSSSTSTSSTSSISSLGVVSVEVNVHENKNDQSRSRRVPDEAQEVRCFRVLARLFELLMLKLPEYFSLVFRESIESRAGGNVGLLTGETLQYWIRFRALEQGAGGGAVAQKQQLAFTLDKLAEEVGDLLLNVKGGAAGGDLTDLSATPAEVAATVVRTHGAGTSMTPDFDPAVLFANAAAPGRRSAAGSSTPTRHHFAFTHPSNRTASTLRTLFLDSPATLNELEARTQLATIVESVVINSAHSKTNWLLPRTAARRSWTSKSAKIKNRGDVMSSSSSPLDYHARNGLVPGGLKKERRGRAALIKKTIEEEKKELDGFRMVGATSEGVQLGDGATFPDAEDHLQTRGRLGHQMLASTTPSHTTTLPSPSRSIPAVHLPEGRDVLSDGVRQSHSINCPQELLDELERRNGVDVFVEVGGYFGDCAVATAAAKLARRTVVEIDSHAEALAAAERSLREIIDEVGGGGPRGDEEAGRRMNGEQDEGKKLQLIVKHAYVTSKVRAREGRAALVDVVSGVESEGGRASDFVFNTRNIKKVGSDSTATAAVQLLADPAAGDAAAPMPLAADIFAVNARTQAPNMYRGAEWAKCDTSSPPEELTSTFSSQKCVSFLSVDGFVEENQNVFLFDPTAPPERGAGDAQHPLQVQLASASATATTTRASHFQRPPKPFTGGLQRASAALRIKVSGNEYEILQRGMLQTLKRKVFAVIHINVTKYCTLRRLEDFEQRHLPPVSCLEDVLTLLYDSGYEIAFSRKTGVEVSFFAEIPEVPWQAYNILAVLPAGSEG